MPTKKKTVKKSSSSASSKFSGAKLRWPIFVLIFAVVGAVGVFLSQAAPVSSATKLSVVSTDLYLGDYLYMRVTNVPKSLLSKPLQVIGACYQDGRQVGSVTNEYTGKEPMIDPVTGLVKMGYLGGSMSNWLLGGGAATCKPDLRYIDNKGVHIIASVSFDAQGYRSVITLDQQQPVNANDPITFTISNLPEGVPKTSLNINIYCDKYPAATPGTDLGYGGGKAYDVNGNPRVMRVINGSWTSTGELTTCTAIVEQFPIAASSPTTTTTMMLASTKFQVRL